MTAQTKDILKSYFETGDMPIGQQFSDLIDSTFLGPNFVVVYDKSDFPDAVGGVITLEDGVNYFVSTFVDLEGDRIVGGIGNAIAGLSSVTCGLSSTSLTGAALISSAYSMTLANLTITADIGVDMDNSVTYSLNWSGVVFSNCGVAGYIRDYSNVILKDSSAIANSGPLTFSGTFDTIAIDGSLIVPSAGNAGIVVSSSTVINRRIRITLSAFVVASGCTGIDVSNSATIPIESYIMRDVNFSGAGTYISGINHTSNSASFKDTIGITNSNEIGQFSMEGNIIPTTFSGPVGTPVPIQGVTVPNVNNQKFTHANNELTYTGAVDRIFIGSGVLSVSGGNAVELSIYIAIDGVVISSSKVTTTTSSSGKAQSIPIQDIGILMQDNKARLYIANESNNNNLTVESINFIVRSLN